MRSRTAAMFAIVVAAALAGWLGFAWNRARHAAPRELDSTELLGAIDGAQETGAIAITPPQGSGGTDPASRRAGLEADTAQVGSVRVAFDGDGRPAAGADVYWFGGAQLAEERWRGDLEELGMGLAFFERNGRHFSCDAEGSARVPSIAGRVQVIATTPTHFGMTTVDRRAATDEPIAIRLRAAFGVDVRVTGARSRAPVRDVVVVASCSQLPESCVGGRTDERGIARLFPLFHEDEPRGTWYARLPGVFFDEIRVVLPMEDRADPLELLLPDSAPAVVRIVDRNGALCPLSGTLRLGWNDREGDPVEPRELRISDGVANLTRIESGLNLHARAKFPGTEEMPTGVFAGGSDSSSRSRFDLVLSSR